MNVLRILLILGAGFTAVTCVTIGNRTDDTFIDVPDPCVRAFCRNGGVCILEPSERRGFICECAPGFFGTHCESDVPGCFASPCQHGGECVAAPYSVEGFICRCPQEYVGTFCHQDRKVRDTRVLIVAIAAAVTCSAGYLFFCISVKAKLKARSRTAVKHSNDVELRRLGSEGEDWDPDDFDDEEEDEMIASPVHTQADYPCCISCLRCATCTWDTDRAKPI